jgi:hypothetical protein
MVRGRNACAHVPGTYGARITREAPENREREMDDEHQIGSIPIGNEVASMNAKIRVNVRWLIACVVVIAISAVMAYEVRHDFGSVDVQFVRFYDPSNVTLAGRVYRPVTANAENKMPGILNLHGYQNDKDVNDPFSIELARRGFAVLAMDTIGHGDSEGGLDLGLFVKPGSTYTVGAQSGYNFLKSLPFVDATSIGVMGHSLGAMESLKLGFFNPDHKALNFVAGFAGAPNLHNVLLTQARFDEFPIFREGQPRVEPLGSNATRMKAFNRTDPVEWNTTYGNAADGSARRAALVNMDHHLLPLTNKAVAEAVDWMRISLKGGKTDGLWIEPTSQIFMWKEIFGLIALLVTFFSMIPLTNLLLETSYFKPVSQPMPSRYVAKPGTWWIFATINAAIGGLLYPPLTSLAGTGDKIQAVIPFLKLPVGNGLFLWFLVNAIVGGALFYLWYQASAKKAGISMAELGGAATTGVLGKTLLLGAILFAWMYVLEGLSQWALGEEFRFAWPFMRQFSEPRRVGYFLIYLVPTLAFFLVNGGIFMFGQIRQPVGASPAATQWVWWLKNLYAGLAGLVVAWAIQYVPWFFFGMGPGYENLGLPSFSALWPLMLIVYIPEFAILLFMSTWFYRRTGRVYLGGLMIASLAVWFLAAGTVIAR